MISFPCPSCKTNLEIPFGQKCKCPGCGTSIFVPSPYVEADRPTPSASHVPNNLTDQNKPSQEAISPWAHSPNVSPNVARPNDQEPGLLGPFGICLSILGIITALIFIRFASDFLGFWSLVFGLAGGLCGVFAGGRFGTWARAIGLVAVLLALLLGYSKQQQHNQWQQEQQIFHR